jgi:endonuclease YncB( thermonuclease family)
MLLLFVIAGLMFAPFKTSAAELRSYAIVRDDGTMRVRGRTIRLFGIHIPPTNRSCRRFERPPKCASRAALALEFKKGANFVHCEPKWKNEDGTITALCRVKGEDLSAYLLERGWAVALPDAPFEYQTLERIARHRGFGVWGIPIDRGPGLTGD